MARILEAAISGFIATGEPVSSGWLYEHHDFGIKPAMIRHILKDLDDEGFLEQPNYSAGRVPSDRGYEYFIAHIIGGAEPDARMVRHASAPMNRHDWAAIAESLSSALGLLAVVSASDDVVKQGLERLMDRLDWQSRDEALEVIHDFEDIDDRISRARPALEAERGVRVYVGRRSPVTRSERLAVAIDACDVGGERVLLVGVGPKRMDYHKVAQAFRGLEYAANHAGN